MIVKEPVCGELYRYHPDSEDNRYAAQWTVSDGEIKGFMILPMTLDEKRKFKMEMHTWLDSYDGKLKCFTAISSIEKIMKQFGFKELSK